MTAACGDRGRAGAGGAGLPRPVPPRRIVAVAPSAVEILFALGLGARVVGVGDWAAHPPETEGLPRIGGLYDPHLEQIARLEPDLAVLLASEEPLRARLEALGIDVLVVAHESLADVEAAIEAIGAATGAEAAAAELLAGWHAGLAPEPLPGRPRLLVSIVREPGRMSDVLTVGRDTFLQELLDRMGAENVFADAPVRYPQVGTEEIVGRRPDVVIELQGVALSAAAARRLLDDWTSLPWGPSGPPCRRLVAGSHTVLPGPRLPRLFRELREAVASCEGRRQGAAR